MSQEQITDAIRSQLPEHCFVEVRGQHTQNGRTVVEREARVRQSH